MRQPDPVGETEFKIILHARQFKFGSINSVTILSNGLMTILYSCRETAIVADHSMTIFVRFL